ncbi:hypothetical protein V9T40_013085 [Parthenolecanium corni]|uniref:Uncharacterized protein n=1 Tax=Parthenolecanium corni TaxID=536013 RepID=A0AAN9Y6U3_9HEMI
MAAYVAGVTFGRASRREHARHVAACVSAKDEWAPGGITQPTALAALPFTFVPVVGAWELGSQLVHKPSGRAALLRCYVALSLSLSLSFGRKIATRLPSSFFVDATPYFRSDRRKRRTWPPRRRPTISPPRRINSGTYPVDRRPWAVGRGPYRVSLASIPIYHSTTCETHAHRV